MPIKSTLIKFDNPWGTYYAGSEIEGTFTVVFSEPVLPSAVTRVQLTVKGEANVEWSESHTETDHHGQNTTTRTVTEYYTAHELYFKTKILLHADNEYYAGECVFPFKTVIPQNVPSSFEGEFGHIRYTAKGKIKVKRGRNKKSLAIFSVISPLDLNKTPGALLPIDVTANKKVGICCFKKGEINGSISSPVSGYVSGQNIPVELNIENASQKKIKEIKLKLKKNISFLSTRPCRREKNQSLTVAEVGFGEVEPGEEKMLHTKLFIPPLPPSYTHYCNIINISFLLSVEVVISGICNRNLNFGVPVIVGTIPLIAPSDHSQPTTSNFADTSYLSLLPPPSYEEAIMINSSKNNHQFQPRYPCYKLLENVQEVADS